MARSIDRRTFLKRAGRAAAVAAGAPLILPGARRRGGERPARRGGRAVGHRDAVRVAHDAGREAAVGLRVRPAHHARSEDLRVPPGARHRVEAVERDADVDVQAPLRREVPRGLGRADRRGRQVHGRAEPQAGRRRRLGAVLPQPPRPHRDARQAHGGAALQEPRLGGAVALHASTSATRTSSRRSTSSRSASRRRRSTRSAPAPTVTSRAGRATITASRRCRTTGARRRPSRRWSSGGSPTPPRGCPACAPARSTSRRSSATTSSRRRRPGSASTSRRTPRCYWVILAGQTTPDREDYCPTCPWVGDPERSEEPRERAQGPAGAEPRGQQEGDHQRALEGQGRRHAVLVLLLSVPQGLQHRLEDPALRSGARQEAPRRGRATPAASRCA